jgi:hypothetical protein
MLEPVKDGIRAAASARLFWAHLASGRTILEKPLKPSYGLR